MPIWHSSCSYLVESMEVIVMKLIRCTHCNCFQNRSHNHCSRCGGPLRRGNKMNLVFFGTLLVTGVLVLARLSEMH